MYFLVGSRSEHRHLLNGFDKPQQVNDILVTWNF